MRFLRFVLVVVVSLFCAVQSAMLMHEKAWGAFGVSLLPFLMIYLPTKSCPWLTAKVRIGLFLLLNFAVIAVYGITQVYGVRLDISLGSGRFQSKMERMTERRAVPLPKGRPKRQGAA